MDRVSQLLLLLAAVGSIDASYRLVFAPPGQCARKRASVKLSVDWGGCLKIRGTRNGAKTYYGLYDCNMDMCEVPASGRVSSQYAFGINPDQYNTDPFDSSVVYIGTMRKYCDILRGTYETNLAPTRWLPCKLNFLRMDASDRANIRSLIIVGDKCRTRIVDIKLMMTHSDCVHNGGKFDGNPGGNDWIECYMSVCMSPVIQCKPSDLWTAVQVCRNPSSSTFTCTYELTVGIEKGETTEKTYGFEVSTTITSEVGVELEGIFTSKLTTSVTTGFNWSTSKSSSRLWTKTSTQNIEIKVPPGKSLGIYQVVGMCGDYKVDTMRYKTVAIE